MTKKMCCLVTAGAGFIGSHLCEELIDRDYSVTVIDDLSTGSTSISRWSYAGAKAVDEFLALAYSKAQKLPIVIARLFNAVGPRQTGRYGMVLPGFIKEALSGKPITVYGNGAQIRTFTYVKDTVRAIVELSLEKKAECETFDVDSSQPISIKKLAVKVKEKTHSRSPIKHISFAKAFGESAVDFEETQYRVPNIAKVKQAIGYRPRYGIDSIIDGTIKYFRDNKNMIRKNDGARKAVLVGFLVFLFFAAGSFNIYAAEQGGNVATERLITLMRPAPAPVEKDRTTAYSYYEPSTVLTGNRSGRWAEITNGFSYQHKNLTGYAAISRFNRYDNIDYTANFGSYLNFKSQYAHIEIGFGWLNDYMYNIQIISEYAHRLYKDLFWQTGYSYRGYPEDDTHIVYPGLIYYFGDSYMSADWGIGYIEGRDTAYYGAVKGNFVITKFLDLWSGVAFGERLYDIYGYDASQENGYILFGGVTFKLYKDIFSIKVGGSYGEEAPKFIKRSLIFSGTVKF